uniref:Nucleoporin NSP1-like C-terminal domain-containing protein n=3 Tax=Octopus bimaculoides TaxID=37653 RepID=A0A0L8I1I7_OCTBM
MVLDLKEIIDHLNTTNTSEENTDPVHQITKILNAHMDSLRWIDQNAGLLNRRVEDISKQMELQRKEQERNYRLVFN